MNKKIIVFLSLFSALLFVLPNHSFACPRSDNLNNCADRYRTDINWRTECDEEIRSDHREGETWEVCLDCESETRTCTYTYDCGTEEQPATCTGTDSYKVNWCEDWCTRAWCTTDSWVEYRASTTSCGPRIEKRNCKLVHTGNCDKGIDEECIRVCDGDTNAEEHGLKEHVTVISEYRCRIWQKAIRTNSGICASDSWGLNNDLDCVCAGGCLEVPQMRLFDNPTYPNSPLHPNKPTYPIEGLFNRYWEGDAAIWDHEEMKSGVEGVENILKAGLDARGFTRGPTKDEIDIALRQKFGREILDEYAIKDLNNVPLPIKMDFDHVMGWRYDGTEEDHPWEYEFILTRTHRGITDIADSEVIDYHPGGWFSDFYYKHGDTEYNIREQKGACFLRPKSKYTWSVRAVCYKPADTHYDGSDIHGSGPPGKVKFTTSIAPELRSIFGDPDSRIHDDYITNDPQAQPHQNKGLFYLPNPDPNLTNADPDWAGKDFINNINTPVVIDWCDLTSIDEYYLTEMKREDARRWIGEYQEKYLDDLSLWSRYEIKIWEWKCIDDNNDGDCEENEYQYVPHMRFQENIHGIMPELIFLRFGEIPNLTEEIRPLFFIDQNRFYLTFGSRYKIQIGRCITLVDANNRLLKVFTCGFGQKWGLKTEGGPDSLDGSVEPIFTPVAAPLVQPLPFSPEFTALAGANYYRLRLSPLGVQQPAQEMFEVDERKTIFSYFYDLIDLRDYVSLPILNSRLIFDYAQRPNDFALALDKDHTLRITPCLDPKSQRCSNESLAIAIVTFRTPGAPPSQIIRTSEDAPYPSPPNKALIPVTLDWDDMVGINSFKVRLYKSDGAGVWSLVNEFIETTSGSRFSHSDLKLNSTYKIKVWSCIDDKGRYCGPLSKTFYPSFTTFNLGTPTNLRVDPYENGEVKTDTVDCFITFNWDSVVGAISYQIKITSPSGAIIKRTVNENEFRIRQRDLIEMGRYEWEVRACLHGGETCGDWSASHSFILEPIIVAGDDHWYGLVVCGLALDNPATGWNDREPCTIAHIPLTVSFIIDFILWDIVPILGFLLILFTAFLYFTAFANANEITQITPKVKKMWKSFAIGLFVLFFGFTIINIFLNIIGFDVNLFGQWYQ